MPNLEKNVLYFRPDFYENDVRAPCADKVEQLLNCKVIVALDWAGVVANINSNVGLVLIQTSVIKGNIGTGFSTFMKMLNNMMKYMIIDGHRPYVALCIDLDSPLELIEESKNYGLHGIVPAGADYGTLETINAIDALLHGREYWPVNIIKDLKKRSTAPVLLYLRPEMHLPSMPAVSDKLEQKVNCKFNVCETWDEFAENVSIHPYALLVHAGIFKEFGITVNEFLIMLSTLTRVINPALSMRLGIVVELDTPAEIVHELMDNNISFIIPGFYGFGIDETIRGLLAILTEEAYAPKYIINKLPISKKVITLASKGIHLTTRQTEVLKLVCNRGLSNKKIASQLHISESTVKIHVSAILKEYGVRNRTQLALAANSSLKA